MYVRARRKRRADERYAAAVTTSPQLTRIIATLGPASDDADVVRRLVEAGATVFRLNFSHGELDTHRRRLDVVRSVAREMGVPLAVLGDLQGPKIRLNAVEGDGIELPTGAEVHFRRGVFTVTDQGPPYVLGSTYDRLVDDVEPGQRVLIDDGAVRMLAVARTDDLLRCTVVTGGRVSSSKGINLPDSNLRTGPLGPRDAEHVRWAVEHDLDFLALSFVRSAAEIRQLRARIQEACVAAHRAGLRLPIIAKIERPEAVREIESIVEEADAIMVARGDLGVEMDIAKVPIVQRRLVETAHAWGRPCIVATQMLQSMIEQPSPTRAEVSDIATAIFARTDAVMLSGETAVGRYPSLAVETMRRVAHETEAYIADEPWTDRAPARLAATGYRTAALAHGVATAARDFRAKFLVVWSQTGGGARYLSQNDLRIPIVAVSSDDRALRQMQLLRGVVPVRMPVPESLALFTARIDAYLLEVGWAAPGDRCIIVAGTPLGTPRTTNALALHEVGNGETGFR